MNGSAVAWTVGDEVCRLRFEWPGDSTRMPVDRALAPICQLLVVGDPPSPEMVWVCDQEEGERPIVYRGRDGTRARLHLAGESVYRVRR